MLGDRSSGVESGDAGSEIRTENECQQMYANATIRPV